LEPCFRMGSYGPVRVPSNAHGNAGRVETASYRLFYDDGRLAGGRKGGGDPVDDVEEEESQRKGLARELVDVTSPSLARLDVHCAREVPPTETLLLDRLKTPKHKSKNVQRLKASFETKQVGFLSRLGLVNKLLSETFLSESRYCDYDSLGIV